MNIRSAHPSDAPALATAHIRSWQEAYSHILPAQFLSGLSVPDRSAKWEQIIEAAESTTDVAEIDGHVVAFCSYAHCRDAGAPHQRAEIWALYAAPSAWGRGVGRALLQHALDTLLVRGYTETALWVFSENERGRRFYEAHGFAVVPNTETWLELGGAKVQELQYLRRHAA